MKNKFEFYKNVITKKYAEFNGRATRSEYWYFVLFNVLIMLALSIVGNIIGGRDVGETLQSLYNLAVLIPSLAVGARRLHDTGRSAWWLLLCLIPIIGWIVLIVFLATDTTPGDNKYGSNPKGMNSASVPTSTPTPKV